MRIFHGSVDDFAATLSAAAGCLSASFSVIIADRAHAIDGGDAGRRIPVDEIKTFPIHPRTDTR